MSNTKLTFHPVQWPAAAALCLAFRRDAWHVSYGTNDGFSDIETRAWFEHLAREHPERFLHVWLAGEIIGQIEYRAPLARERNDSCAGIEIGGYINLFYLSPNHRGKSLGRVLHDYVIADLRSKRCKTARLRVIPGNTVAERFYAKNGWQAEGAADARGQLMVLALAQMAGLNLPYCLRKSRNCGGNQGRRASSKVCAPFSA